MSLSLLLALKKKASMRIQATQKWILQKKHKKQKKPLSFEEIAEPLKRPWLLADSFIATMRDPE